MPVVLEPNDSGDFYESIILDPETIDGEPTDRTELDLHSGAILVKQDGIDWGEAAIQAFMAELERGQVPVDYKVPNREMHFPLMAQTAEGIDYASARERLQAKVALIHDEGGWLQRVMRDGRVLWIELVNASLKFGGSTFAATRDLDADIELTLEGIPDFFGEETQVLTAEVATDAASFTITDVQGDYPGRFRARVTESNGDDIRGLLWAFRARHYPTGSARTTARSVYLADDLTLAGNAVSDTAPDMHAASAFIDDTNLSNWTSIVEARRDGGDFLTHEGSYQVYVRARSPDGGVRLRWVWDVGDLALPVVNEEWVLPGPNNWFMADLGQMRIDRAPVGPHRWLGLLQAKGENGDEGIAVDEVIFQPLDEGSGRLRSSDRVVEGVVVPTVYDNFDQADPSDITMDGVALPSGQSWSRFGDTTDYEINHAASCVLRDASSDSGYCFQAVDGLSYDAPVVQVDIQQNHADTLISGTSYPKLGPMGVALRFTDEGINIPVTVERHDYGMVLVFGSTPVVLPSGLGAPQGVWWTLRAALSADGHFSVWIWPRGGASGSPVLSGYDPTYAAGAFPYTDPGSVALADNFPTSGDHQRLWDNFIAYDADAVAFGSHDAVCFGNRSVELRTEGMFREGIVTDDAPDAAYGPVSHVVNDLPRVPPSRLEGRDVELFLRPSFGDYEDKPEHGSVDYTVDAWYRPSWLIAPGTS